LAVPLGSTPEPLFEVGSLYQVRLAAQNIKGWSLWTEWSHTVNVPPNGWLIAPCDKITNLRLRQTAPMRGLIQLEWDSLDTSAAGGDDVLERNTIYEIWGRKLVTEHVEEWDRSQFALMKNVSMLFVDHDDDPLTALVQSVPGAAFNVDWGSQWQLKVRGLSLKTRAAGIFSDVLTVVASDPMPQVRDLAVVDEPFAGPVARWLPPADSGALLILGYKIHVTKDGSTAEDLVDNTQLFYEIPVARPFTVAVRALSKFGDGVGTQLDA